MASLDSHWADQLLLSWLDWVNSRETKLKAKNSFLHPVYKFMVVTYSSDYNLIMGVCMRKLLTGKGTRTKKYFS